MHNAYQARYLSFVGEKGLTRLIEYRRRKWEKFGAFENVFWKGKEMPPNEFTVYPRTRIRVFTKSFEFQVERVPICAL